MKLAGTIGRRPLAITLLGVMTGLVIWSATARGGTSLPSVDPTAKILVVDGTGAEVGFLYDTKGTSGRLICPPKNCYANSRARLRLRHVTSPSGATKMGCSQVTWWTESVSFH